VTLRGVFDIDGIFEISGLAPRRGATIDLSLRPQRDQYGPAVPLEIAVTYADIHGGRYTFKRRILLRVRQDGAIADPITPLEIDMRSDRLPRGAEREATPDTQPVAVEMPGGLPASQEDIEQQRALLATYRRTLAHLVGQAAQYGGESLAPPHIANNLHEARDNIQRIKQVLGGWGVVVASHPNDTPS
jgi:hypothetical protein